jgi:hypothetical protein
VNHIPQTERAYRGIEDNQSRVVRQMLLEKEATENQERAQPDDCADDGVEFEVGLNPSSDLPEPLFSEASPHGLSQIERFLTAIQSCPRHSEPLSISLATTWVPRMDQDPLYVGLEPLNQEMTGNVIEAVIGAGVLIVAELFLFFAYTTSLAQPPLAERSASGLLSPLHP